MCQMGGALGKTGIMLCNCRELTAAFSFPLMVAFADALRRDRDGANLVPCRAHACMERSCLYEMNIDAADCSKMPLSHQTGAF